MNRKKKIWMTVIGIAVLFLAGGLWYQSVLEKNGAEDAETDGLSGIMTNMGQQAPSAMPEVSPEPEQAGQQQTPVLVVFVCGAVKCPDVYELPCGSRLHEAVKLAGGFAEDADASYHNLARILSDGERIYIPTFAETEEYTLEQKLAGQSGVSEEKQGADTVIVNLNTATVTQLTSLPGIGQSKAESIIEYRTRVGAFAAIEELMNISGIGEAMFDRIKDRVTVK